MLVDKPDATGTYYRRNRSYDPNTARFTQEDPLGLAGGLNLYGFAGGDPVNSSDPFGQCADVTVKGNKVHIKIPVRWGEDAAKDSAFRAAFSSVTSRVKH